MDSIMDGLTSEALKAAEDAVKQKEYHLFISKRDVEQLLKKILLAEEQGVMEHFYYTISMVRNPTWTEEYEEKRNMILLTEKNFFIEDSIDTEFAIQHFGTRAREEDERIRAKTEAH